MEVIFMLIERYVSPSPKLFKIITWCAVLVILITQFIMWIDNKIPISFVTDQVNELLNDAKLFCIGLALSSGATTSDKGLQKVTSVILNEKENPKGI